MYVLLINKLWYFQTLIKSVKLQEVPEAAKFREKGLDNIDLLDIMFKDTTATGNLAWTPSSGVLPTDFETPTEGDEEVKTHDLTQPPNSTQTT